MIFPFNKNLYQATTTFLFYNFKYNAAHRFMDWIFLIYDKYIKLSISIFRFWFSLILVPGVIRLWQWTTTGYSWNSNIRLSCCTYKNTKTHSRGEVVFQLGVRSSNISQWCASDWPLTICSISDSAEVNEVERSRAQLFKISHHEATREKFPVWTSGNFQWKSQKIFW